MTLNILVTMTILLPRVRCQVWSAVVDGGLTNSSLNSKGTAVLLVKQVRPSLLQQTQCSFPLDLRLLVCVAFVGVAFCLLDEVIFGFWSFDCHHRRLKSRRLRFWPQTTNDGKLGVQRADFFL